MNASTTSHAFNISFPTPALRSTRTRLIAEWFGLLRHGTAHADQLRVESILEPSLLIPSRGQIVLIQGASGSGKSMLLRQMQSHLAGHPQFAAIDLSAIELPDKPVVDCFDERMSLDEALKILSRVGLAEAWTYLRTPQELSEGQRWRLRLGIAIASARRLIETDRSIHPIIVCDEFAAVLDRITAAVVSHALRRAIDSDSSISAALATSHDDLQSSLEPDRTVRCDFGIVSVEVRKIDPRMDADERRSEGRSDGFRATPRRAQRCRRMGLEKG